MGDETGEVIILADIAGEVAEPMEPTPRSARPTTQGAAPSRDNFRRARRSRRWRFRATVGCVLVGAFLMVVGLVFVLAQPTSEIDPPVVAGETTVRGTTSLPTTDVPTTELPTPTAAAGPETTVRGDQPDVSVK